MTSRVELTPFRDGRQLSSAEDTVACEEPLEIRVRGRAVAVTMRTPGHDQELAAGFLLSEAVVQTRADLIEIAHCQTGEALLHGNTVNVFLSRDVQSAIERMTRHVFASSSCGLCGKATIEAVHQSFPPVAAGPSFAAAVIRDLPWRLRAAQRTFDQTGGLHAAGIFDQEGNLIVAREDVGRHNAVDKVIGHGLLNNLLPFDKHVLLVSGRASFEIIQKALSARIPLVAAVSAPSSLAVEFAAESNQTLVGFLRDANMNIYSHPGRVTA